mmetsp:Transcript_53432/g.88870  ORF Transcript_53432/g.88870 Transcript_53432/m.88870 type:complete len:207 (-) Transcript_53432:422-1042(-)
MSSCPTVSTPLRPMIRTRTRTRMITIRILTMTDTTTRRTTTSTRITGQSTTRSGRDGLRRTITLKEDPLAEIVGTTTNIQGVGTRTMMRNPRTSLVQIGDATRTPMIGRHNHQRPPQGPASDPLTITTPTVALLSKVAGPTTKNQTDAEVTTTPTIAANRDSVKILMRMTSLKMTTTGCCAGLKTTPDLNDDAQGTMMTTTGHSGG